MLCRVSVRVRVSARVVGHTRVVCVVSHGVLKTTVCESVAGGPQVEYTQW